ncbi:acyl-CoA carboxylase subunit epsilon [Nocardioides sp. zg-ZUI104]|uniref:acyl-CoA carboxylase subunit epsilon n=1 Tax=Nocardioides faecalis TaxID=2803858 RepID=UPI001BCB1C6A|nr:acyl-CoA carboxylase subunit epsilon [Nocardioides faecalis]MBS4751601.1 acyl-CoA carboxylase subunit epsilon [Nocardioides faecalis]
MSTEEGAEQTPVPAAALLRVITPHTSPEEVAAIVAVISALGGGEPAPKPPRSEWAHPARAARTSLVRSLPHGRGAWRSSGLPR